MPSKLSITDTLFGQRWRIRFSRLRGKNDGYCVQSRRGKELIIHNGLDEQDELRITLHEMLHVGDWYKDEEWVDQLSDDMARILIRLGWTKTS